MARNGMKCKDIFGKKICKFGSGASVSIYSFPSTIENPLDITIYSAASCKVCKSEVNQFKKRLKPISNLTNVRIIDVDQDKNALQKGFLKLPAVEIGSDIISTRANDGDILKAIKNNLPRDEIL